MQKRLQINYEMVSGSEITTIPVTYEVNENAELSLKIIKCRVDLPGEAIPSWLFPHHFEISSHNRYGFYVTNYDDKDIRTPDAAFFRYKVYADIMLHERFYNDNGLTA